MMAVMMVRTGKKRRRSERKTNKTIVTDRSVGRVRSVT